MRSRNRNVLVAVASTVLVLVLVMAVAEKPSPGPISQVHAQLADLDGGESCSSCHGGWLSNMRQACSECHEDIAAQLEDGEGLHGRLDVALVGNCSTCHSEHHGAQFGLVNRLAFAQAGVADPDVFDHRMIGYTLEGKHLELACEECHTHARDQVLAEGTKRFLGLSRDCKSCHEDPHEGRMQLACVTCHGQDSFEQREVAGHERWLPLDGAHGEKICRDCHAADQPHALESLTGQREGARGCGDCHESQHDEGFLRRAAAAAATRKVDSCSACHASEQSTFALPVATMTPQQHLATGFPLAEPHGELACTKCHDPALPWAERHPGRKPDGCAACHVDPHGAQFADGPFAAQGCVSCHARTHFAPHGFDLEHHAKTHLPLDGRHAEAECSVCHADPAEGTPRRFAGTPHRCEACHDDSHRDAFAAHGETLAAAPRGTCAVCHTTAAWSGVEHQRFDHADWTGFAIDGAHGQIECTDCHALQENPESDGRRFGRVPEHADGKAVCTACHGDPHEGAFDVAGRPTEVDGRSGCLRCHETASFRALQHGFDHDLFTGFSLVGRHGELDCSACHERLRVPTASGRTWQHAKGRDCSACHEDPHRGQFERRGQTDCMRCHKSTTTFATLSFRHNLDSRFPIEEQHRKVACSSCHKKETVNGITFVRYLPLPTQCVDCHGREEGGASSRRRRR